MLYTVIPLSQIYRQDVSLDGAAPGGVWKEEHIPYENGYIQISSNNEKKVISRLLSSNMADYLKDEFQPGKIYLE